jgi:Secretion system C-terminal sorting domain
MLPNPVTTDLTIEMPDNIGSEIQIFDITGRLVWQQKINASIQTLHLPPLPSGAYVYKILQQQQVLKTGKLVKP